MGTPKFSFKEALKVIFPYLDHLSFQHRACFEGTNDFKDEIDGIEYVFTLWQSTVTVSAALQEGAMLHAMPIYRNVLKNARGRVVKVFYRRLLIDRTNTQAFLGFLFLQTSTFIINHVTPAHLKLGSLVLRSSESAIQYVEVATLDRYWEDRCLGRPSYFPDDFPTKFWQNIAEWVKTSMAVRQKALESLEALDGKVKPLINALDVSGPVSQPPTA